MKSVFLRFFCFVLVCTTSVFAQSIQTPSSGQPQGFIINNGQWDSEVLARTVNGNVVTWITSKGFVFDVASSAEKTGKIIPYSSKFLPPDHQFIEETKTKHHVISAQFSSTSKAPFYLVHNKSWSLQQNQSTYPISFMNAGKQIQAMVVPSLEIVNHKQTVVCTVQEGKFRYDISYNSSKEKIQTDELVFSGSTKLSVSNNNELVVSTPIGNLVQGKLQVINGSKIVPTEFAISGNKVTFETKSTINSELGLVIDPTVWSTFIGTSMDEVVLSTDKASNGDVVVAGYTTSIDFPKTEGAYVSTNVGAEDGFVTRFNSKLRSIVYSFIIGGGGTDKINSLVVSKDGKDALYFVGETNSTNFPVTTGAIKQTHQGGFDAFLCRVDPLGKTLTYSSYFGGLSDDKAYALYCDGLNAMYFCGETKSSNFPTKSGTFRTSQFGTTVDGFVSKVSSSGNIVYSGYLGGLGTDKAFGISASKASETTVFVTGVTNSNDFPALTSQVRPGGGPGPIRYQDPFQLKLNITGTGTQSDAFLTNVNDDGSKIFYSTFFGGAGDDGGVSVVVDDNRNALVAGYTNSTNIPMNKPFVSNKSQGVDAMMFEIDFKGITQNYGTYFGGNGDDYVTNMAGDGTNIYFVGRTTSNNLPVTTDAFQETYGGAGDAFLCKMSYEQLNYLTYIGGKEADVLNSIAFIDPINVITGGSTKSSGITVSDSSYQITKNAGEEGIVFKSVLSSLNVTSPQTGSYCEGQNITVVFNASTLPANTQYLIEYTSGNGAPWKSITNATKNYVWSIPKDGMVASSKYQIRVTHTQTGISSTSAEFTVKKLPVFESLTKDTSLCSGLPLTLQANVTGDVTGYSWHLNGSAVAGGTSSSFVIPSLSASTAGAYTLTVTGSCGNKTSTAINVVALPSAEITTEIADASTTVGSSATFTVVATGKDLRYRWQKDGNAISGAPNAPTYSISSVQKFDEGKYRVIVLGECGADTSREASLAVSTTSVDEDFQSNEYTLHPNPANSVIKVDLGKEHSDFYAVLLDMEGKEIHRIYHSKSSSVVFNTSLLANGVYFVRIIDESTRTTKPIVVSH